MSKVSNDCGGFVCYPQHTADDDTLEFSNQPQICQFSLSVKIDRLLGRWLKLKKLALDPNGKTTLVAMSYLQSHNHMNEYFKIRLMDAFGECNILSESYGYSLPKFWLETRTSDPHYSETELFYGHLDAFFPFAFIQLPDHSQTLNNADIDVFFVDGTSSTPNIVGTRDPNIYLLIFSSIIEDEADCAELMHSYSKHTNLPLFRLENNVPISVALKFKQTIASFTYFRVFRKSTYQTLSTQAFTQNILDGNAAFDLAAMTYFNNSSFSQILDL